MKKIVISFFIAICIIFAFISPINITLYANNTPEIKILYENSMIDNLVINQSKKYEIFAQCSPENSEYIYRWQICADTKSSMWVEIQGESENTLNVSYPMVCSLLDDSGSVYLRCAVTFENEVFYSDYINVAVSFDVESNGASISDQTDSSSIHMDKAQKLALTSTGDNEYVYITINYKDELSGKEIYNSYNAKIQCGTDFKQDVRSPTFLGYEPFYEDESGNINNGATVKIDRKNLIQDLTIDVYYEAIEVQYTVRYFFQNINNDLYTENEDLYYTGKAFTGTIITNEELENHAGNPTGFKKLYHQPESVAADGSTVFECYYDRNYSLVKFDMDGGYGVEPIYARYETPFLVNNPVKPGYVFDGWDLLDENGNGDGKADTLPKTMPAENQNYKALWKNIDTTITVVYWLQDPNDIEKYNYWASYNTDAKSGDILNASNYKDYKENTAIYDSLGHEKYFSHFNEEKTNGEENGNGKVFVKGDGSSVVNVYYDRNEYTLKFYYAMSSGSGNDIKYYVIGGSTYYFGSLADETIDRSDAIKLIDQYMTSRTSERGGIKNLPELNEIGKARNYTKGIEKSTVGDTSTEYKYYYISFKAKYGADISKLWPCNIFESVERTDKDSTNGWDQNSAFVSAWNGEYNVYYSQKNTNQTIKGNYDNLNYQLLWDSSKDVKSDTISYLCFWENGANINWSIPKLWEYNLWLPLLDNESEEGKTIKTYKDIKYKLYRKYETCDNSDGIDAQTQTAVEGFEALEKVKRDIDTPEGYYDAFAADFYYKRNQYNLEFYNYNGEIKDKREKVRFETLLSDKFFVPDYPSNLEEDAYEFAGWYTSSGCFKGTEFGDIDSFGANLMPARDLKLYAKWVPKTRIVRFFQTYQDMLEYEQSGDVSGVIKTDAILHGNILEVVENPIDNTGYNYTFVGWFYENNNTKSAFTPYDMPITKDMNVFAEWSSHNVQPYMIHYVLHTPETDTKWLSAIKEASGESPVEQIRYDIVVNGERRGYVYYCNEWHRCVADDVTGYAYQGSTRTFTAKAGNPLNQLYSEFENGYFPTVASHSVTMQYENSGTDQPKQNIYTFTYVFAKDVSYTVRYIDKKTGIPLDDDVTVNTSNSVVTERFKVITDYIPDAFYKRLVLSIKENPELSGDYIGSENNVITFYYTQNETASFYAVHYMLQKPDTEGKDYKIDGTGDYSESDTLIEGIADINSNITITPSTFAGFTLVSNYAVAKIDNNETTSSLDKNKNFNLEISKSGSELYIFYTRNKYTITVKYVDYDTGKELRTPKEYEQEFGKEINETAIELSGKRCVSNTTQKAFVHANSEQNVITFFYTDLLYGNLKIERENSEDESNRTQIFLYQISDNKNSDNIFYASIKGSGSITIKNIPYGDYTVKQLNDWSWRYSDAKKSVTVNNAESSVSFGDESERKYWLNGNSEPLQK